MSTNNKHLTIEGLTINENSLGNSKVIKLNETQTIKCSNCNADLLRIAVKNTVGVENYKFVVECPFCDDKSFQYKVEGLFRWIPLDKVVVTNMLTDDQLNVVTFQTQRVSK